VTPRTAWFIEMRDSALSYTHGTLGYRARHRLIAHEDFDDVMLLAEAARAEEKGEPIQLCLDEAIETLRAIESPCGGKGNVGDECR